MNNMKVLNKIQRLKMSKVKGFLYEVRLEWFVPIKTKLNEKVTICPIKDGKGVELFRNERVKDAFQKMEKSGQICIGAYIDGKLVGHAACILPEKEFGSFKVKNSAYIHYCYVDPQWRGYGIYPNMLSWIVRKVLEVYEIPRVTITTSPENIASQKGLMKIGFRFVKKYTYIKWWRIIWRKIVV